MQTALPVTFLDQNGAEKDGNFHVHPTLHCTYPASD